MSVTNDVPRFATLVDKVHQVVHGDSETVVETDGGPVRSLAKLVADKDAEFNATGIIGEVSQNRQQAEAAALTATTAADAALLSRGVFPTVEAALSNGVRGIANLVGGSSGTDGIFDLTFTGGGGTGAAGVFVVEGGAVVSVVILTAGKEYTSAPLMDFSASAGLIGATADILFAPNVGEDEYFSVPGDDTETYLVLYRKIDGAAIEQVEYPSSAPVRALQAAMPTLARSADSQPAGDAVTQPGERFLAPMPEGYGVYLTVANLYDAAARRDGRYVNKSDGGIYSSAGWACSDFIPVEEGRAYTISSSANRPAIVGFFNAASDSGSASVGVFGNGATTLPATWIAPPGAKFMVINVQTASVSEPAEIMVNVGSEAAPFAPFGSSYSYLERELVSRTLIDEVAQSKTSENLYDTSARIVNSYINNSGSFIPGAGWARAMIPVTEGMQITISANAAKWHGLAFYGGLSESTLVAGSVNLTASLPLTVTAPTDGYLGLNVESTSVPEPSQLMVNEGPDPLPYEPFGSRLVINQSSIWPPIAAPENNLSLALTLAGAGAAESYIQALDAGVSWSFVAFPPKNVVANPCRFNLRKEILGALTIRDGADDIAPDHVFGSTVGANHGYSLGECTATGHGKTAADEGAVYAREGAEYIIAKAVNANTVLLADMTGNNLPPNGTYAHVRGGATSTPLTVTARTSKQWYPPHRDYEIDISLDGKSLADISGEFEAVESVRITESCSLLAREDIIAAWEAVGGMSAGWEPEGDPSLSQTIQYTYHAGGQLTLARDWLAIKPVPTRDLMGLQVARLGAQTYYIPGAMPFVYDGETLDYSLGVPADRTVASAVSVFFDETNLQPHGEYAHRLLSVYAEAVLAVGFLPVGDAAYDVRRDRVSSTALEIRGNSGKVYFRVLDTGEHVMAPGTGYSVVGYRVLCERSAERTAFYHVPYGEGAFIFVDWHDKAGLDRLPIWSHLVDRKFEVIEAVNAWVAEGVLSSKLPVLVDAADSRATLILHIK